MLTRLILLTLVSLTSCLGCSSEPAPGPVDPDCKVEGRCPNVCAGGTAIEREICSSDDDCRCGLTCFESSCEIPTGDLKGCTCLGDPVPGEGIDILGSGKNTPWRITVDVIATSAEGLATPRDLAFNPEFPDQLWIVNLEGPAMVILRKAGTAEQSFVKNKGSSHFMAKPSSLAFGQPGTLATAHEEDEKTQDDTPATFMGPTLWTSDIQKFDANHGSHLDMMHNSPNGAGIAWAGEGNTYFIFDGYHWAITRYEFNGDHGLGGTDHTDGIVARFGETEFRHVRGIPSHLEFDKSSGLLYISDTGNNRIAVLDTSADAKGSTITTESYDSATQYKVKEAVISTLIEGGDFDIEAPSGLALHDGMIFITDNATSKVYAFDKKGRLIDWLDLSREVEKGGLMGIEFDDQGRLYLVDAVANRVLRLTYDPSASDDADSSD